MEYLVQRGLFEDLDWAELLPKSLALVTDESVKTLYGNSLQNRLRAAGHEVHLFTVPKGEASKSRSYKARLEDQMMAAGLGRDSALISLGGGVISDLSGFVAATYCRGIPYISIPTTLLAQVDASLGGKVGINTSFGKNLIGAFHPPDLVLVDPDLLSTLPEEELRCGMAEVIKYALIASETLFAKLQKNASYDELIYESCAIKMAVVKKDPHERGLRRILNFGHTVGHAVELMADYKVSHGEAVAVGMLVESHMSHTLGYLSQEELKGIEELLHAHDFALKLPEGDLVQAMRLDKKAQGGTPRFVLLHGIGKTQTFGGDYCSTVDNLEESLAWLRSR